MGRLATLKESLKKSEEEYQNLLSIGSKRQAGRKLNEINGLNKQINSLEATLFDYTKPEEKQEEKPEVKPEVKLIKRKESKNKNGFLI